MQRKHITTFLTYERHVEPPLHLLELVVDAAARPGPGLEARALDAGVRGAAPLVRPARLRLPVSAPVSVATPPLPLTLREDRVELVVVRAQRDLNLHHGIPEDGAPSVEQNIEQHEPPLAPPVFRLHHSLVFSLTNFIFFT